MPFYAVKIRIIPDGETRLNLYAESLERAVDEASASLFEDEKLIEVKEVPGEYK